MSADDSNTFGKILLAVLTGIIAALLLVLYGIYRAAALIGADVMILFVGIFLLWVSLAKITTRYSRATRAWVKTLVLVSAFSTFGTFTIGEHVGLESIIRGSIAIAIAECGSEIVGWTKEALKHRVADRVLGGFERVDAAFRSQSVMYLVIPVGAAAGYFVATTLRLSQSAAVQTIVSLVLMSVLLVLSYLLVLGARRMSYSLIDITELAEVTRDDKTQGAEGAPQGNKPILAVSRGAVRLGIPSLPAGARVDLACDVSHIRRIYFYNVLHTIVLMSLCAWMMLSLRRVPVTIPFVGATLVSATVVVFVLFSLVPYAVGQKNLHFFLLRDLHGARYEEEACELREKCPLVPHFEVFGAFLSAGSTVALVMYLAEQLLAHMLNLK